MSSCIVYALIARRRDVLCEYTSNNVSGNFATVTRVLLTKLPIQDGRAAYLYDEQSFCYIVDDSITFLCMTGEQTKTRLAFSFLEDIKGKWRERFGVLEKSALAFSLDDAFRPVLKDRIEFYSSNGMPDNFSTVQSKIDSVKEVMVENIEKVLERGERIELLVHKTDRLAGEAFRFNRNAKSLKHELWCRACRTKLLCLAVVLLIVTASVALVCGLSLGKCTSTSKQ